MKQLFFLSIATIVLLSSCSKSATNNTPPVNTTDTSVNTFQPHKTGCFWKYLSKLPSGSIRDTITITSTGRDTTFDNASYKVFTRNGLTTNGFQFQYYDGAKYRQRFDTLKLAGVPLVGSLSIPGVDLFYYSETAAKGTGVVDYFINPRSSSHKYSVTTPFGAQDIDTKSITTTDTTNQTISLNGYNFTNVTTTTAQLQYFDDIGLPPSNTWKAMAKMKFYIAKSIGIIKIETYDQTGTLSNIQELFNYNIVP